MLSIRTVLHPTDYSELSHPAFDLACSLARDFRADLIICHVAPPPIIAAGEGVVTDFPTGESEQMAVRLEQVTPGDPQVRVTHKLLRGDPAAEIIRLAGEVKADLIVIGQRLSVRLHEQGLTKPGPRSDDGLGTRQVGPAFVQRRHLVCLERVQRIGQRLEVVE